MSRDSDKRTGFLFVRDHIRNPIYVKMRLVNMYGFVQSTVSHMGCVEKLSVLTVFLQGKPIVNLLCIASAVERVALRLPKMPHTRSKNGLVHAFEVIQPPADHRGTCILADGIHIEGEGKNPLPLAKLRHSRDIERRNPQLMCLLQ